jgi:hypothetical protein
MNKFLLLVVLFFPGYLLAQKVTVTGSSEKVKGDATEGYGTVLEGKKTDVSAAWIKYLKEIGKVKQGDPITLSEPVFNGLIFANGVIYSFVKEKGESTSIWLGIKTAEWESTNISRINNELQKTVYHFGVKFYRDKIQVQIDEAQEALDAVDKQKQRTANQTKDLTIQLANNKQEKTQLEKSLETNKAEDSVLNVKLNHNKKVTDSLSQSAIQIQKVKDMHLERQRKVN